MAVIGTAVTGARDRFTMKHYKIFGFALLGLQAIGAGYQDDILLRRELKEGSKDTYAYVMKSKQVVNNEAMGMGEQEISIDGTMNISYKIGAPDADKKKSEIEIMVTDIKMDLGGAAAQASGMMGDLPKEIKMKGKIDNLGSVSDVKANGMSAQMQMMMGGASSMASSGVIFPEKALKIGDSWDMVLPKNPMMGKESKTVPAKLVGEKTIDGIACYEISYEGKVPLNVDLSQLAEEGGGAEAGMANMKMTMSGTMDLKGVTLVEKTTGRMISSEATVKTDGKLELPEMNMTMGMKGDVSTTMKLKK